MSSLQGGAQSLRAPVPPPAFGRDLRAAFALFLVALPLCLGIAHAAGAPPLAGLWAGIVGGLVVGALSGSALTVTGPAAGLILLMQSGIAKFGLGAFAVCVMLAGGIQVLLGGLGLGRLAQFVPNSVVRGMLAAIGLVLVLKQLPHAMGYDADYEGDDEFLQTDGENTLSGLWHGLSDIHPGALMVALSALVVLVVWQSFPRVQQFTRFMPRELAAVLVGTLVSELLGHTSYALGVEHRLDLPDWSEGLLPTEWPALTMFANPEIWRMGIAIAWVASLETLLCVEAVDRLDPERRTTPRNRELLAQGAGNMLSGVLGGLPVTAVIVRSVTNTQAGARSRISTILHGALLLLAMLALSPLLMRVPLACLAVVLIAIGFRLTHYDVYRSEFKKGASEFAPFIITVVAVLFTDMLVGALIGLACALFFLVLRQYRSAVLVTDDGQNRLVRLRADIAFVHRPLLSRALQTQSAAAEVVIDGSRVRHMDPEIIELLENASIGRAETKARVTVLRNPANTHPFFRDDEGLT